MKKIFFPLVIAFAITSCDKKEVEPEPEPEPIKDPIVAVDVLNTNSGFTSVFDSAYSLGGVNNQNSIGINDFTLETNNNFNFAYYTEIATQQSPFRTNFRYTKNLSSNQFISLPLGANQFPINLNMSYDKVDYQFFPYGVSNFEWTEKLSG